MSKGKIVAGFLAPHPPHLVYAENAPQNEPKSEGGWEVLRWGYEKLRETVAKIEFDAFVILSPHWRTYVGTHILCYPEFRGKSVDPVFPHLFRYNYNLKCDVDLAEGIFQSCQKNGVVVKKMTNPDFRIDYGTITSCHLVDPHWSKPIVGISSHAAAHYFNTDVLQAEMKILGESTKFAIEASGKRVILLASQSLSHRHFTTESQLPEDMSFEHITSHHLYQWDMKIIEMMKQGKAKEILDIMTDFTEQAVSESDSGSLMWMLYAMGVPDYPAKVHSYGTVIGTGNAVAEWLPRESFL
jgi:2-aminophenol/2-amino-5-chlorophenol 1,6-dioxygenase beta subunit